MIARERKRFRHTVVWQSFGPETSWCVCNLAQIRKLRTSGQRLPDSVDGAESNNACVLVAPK
eukprot:1834428-Prymnesium_polylepis.1